MTATDKERLAEIYLKTRQETFHWMPKEHFKLSDFENDIKDEVVFVSEANCKILGFISLWMPDNFIHHLYVDSTFQSVGIGSKLLEYGLNQMSRPAGLKCVVRNERAVEFYKKKGWYIREDGVDEMGPYYFFELE